MGAVGSAALHHHPITLAVLLSLEREQISLVGSVGFHALGCAMKGVRIRTGDGHCIPAEGWIPSAFYKPPEASWSF